MSACRRQHDANPQLAMYCRARDKWGPESSSHAAAGKHEVGSCALPAAIFYKQFSPVRAPFECDKSLERSSPLLPGHGSASLQEQPQWALQAREADQAKSADWPGPHTSCVSTRGSVVVAVLCSHRYAGVAQRQHSGIWAAYSLDSTPAVIDTSCICPWGPVVNWWCLPRHFASCTL